MHKLFLLLKKYWNLIIFILLLGFSFSLIAKRNSIQGVDIINSSNSIVGTVYSWQFGVKQYFKLRTVNDSLLNENAALRNQLSLESFADTFQNVTARIGITEPDTNKIKIMSNDTALALDSSFRKSSIRKIVRYGTYEYIPARVVNNSIADDRINFITINRGTKDGIAVRMPVVTGNGIVGRVVNVSENYSVIRSVLSEGNPYRAKLMDGRVGSIEWEKGSANAVILTQIPKIADAQIGDSVWTSGYSFFPENIMIGTIAEIAPDKKTNALNLRVLLSTNFRKIQYVYVVIDGMGDEKENLEKETKNAHKDKK